MKKLLILSAMMMVFQANAAGDAARGKLIYGRKKTAELKATGTKPGNCLQCHGKMGMGKAKKNSKGVFKLNLMKGPRISGLEEAYVYEQLKAIQGKKRKTKHTSTMYTRIKKYTDQDLMDLAAYVATVINPGAGKYKSEVWPREK